MKSVDFLSRVNDVCTAGKQAGSARKLFQVSLQLAVDLFEARRGSIYIFASKDLCLQACVGMKQAEKIIMSKRLGQGVMGKVVKLKKPMYVDNIAKDRRFKNYQPREGYKTSSFVCAPLMLKDKVIGIINISDKLSGKSFSNYDMELLDFVSSQIALNVQRVQLQSHFKQFVEQASQETKKLQHKVVQQERLASLGKLVGGIAHEFNNPLDGVMRYTNLALQLLGEEQPVVREYLLEVKMGLKRMSNIVQNLLACARNTRPVKDKVDVNAAVEAVIKDLAPQLIQKNAVVTKALAPHLPPIADWGLERIVHNLVRNALDALERGGTIDIRTASGQGHVTIAVKDNGKGIPQENLEKIFEPFFTTKQIEQGCGLGLTIVSEIVKNYNGKIDVQSTSHQGTIFTVVLPT